jgi:hypothetical protein
MATKRFKCRANFPVLGQQSYQEVEVMGGNWVVAIGAAARALKKLPIMHRRRVAAVSIVIELCEGQPATLVNEPGPAVQTVQTGLSLEEDINNG